VRCSVRGSNSRTRTHAWRWRRGNLGDDGAQINETGSSLRVQGQHEPLHATVSAGRGVLLGGVPGVSAAEVVILANARPFKTARAGGRTKHSFGGLHIGATVRNNKI
jgi:hypothetical protein